MSEKAELDKIRMTLLVNERRGTFGEWRFDSSESTYENLVNLLHFLITGEPIEQASTSRDVIKTKGEE